MSITVDTVKKIARLSRLHLSPEEEKHYASEINSILNWVEQLQKVNTDGVEPMASVGGTNLRFREDKVTDGGKQEAVLANAPAAEYGCFVVPKVIE